MEWRIHSKAVTASTNEDARGGRPGDVFTAKRQSAGRGRLGHSWQTGEGENLAFSCVIGTAGCGIAAIATLPLVVGIAVAETVRSLLDAGHEVAIKWPNDVWVNGRKICGILCERNGDAVIAGVGLNVGQTVFPDEISSKATSLALCGATRVTQGEVLGKLLETLDALVERWRECGFAGLKDTYDGFDCLKGRTVSVLRSDGDEAPLEGVCGGVADDGSLLVGGENVYAGEAHVLDIRR